MQAPNETYTSLNDFITKTRKLLTQEQEAEKEDFLSLTSSKTAVEIEEEGAGLANMTIINCKEGFYDRIVITAVKAYYSQKNRLQIPQHCKLQVGDDVAIYSGDTMIAEGIIYRKSAQKIKISINVDPQENQDFEDMKVNIILKWNQVTYRRYFQILQFLESPQEDIPLANLFFTSTCQQYQPRAAQPFKTEKMNEQQNIAIGNGLTQLCHLIHGPPGTGKTTTVCELIVQAVSKGQKVLACAPSNIAVDNIVEGICRRVNCVRVGNPARIINDVIERCLDFLVGKSEGQWKAEQKKLNSAQKKLKRTKVKSERKEIYGEIKQIRTQIKGLQEQVITEILEDASVLCCTNVGAADKVFKKYLSKRKFDLVVIDECGQGLEVSCWIPISKARRVVLAGDHKQLPPTVKFQSQSLLSYTLFSRCMQQLPYLTSTMLQIQYRMNKQIMGWSNSQFYENRLQAHQSVSDHTLKQLYKDINEEYQQSVLLFIDTAGCQVGEYGGELESKFNIGEADIVSHLYRRLLGFGVSCKDIAILTPYSKQVSYIKNLLAEQQVQVPQVSTVDGIQGREKECIIISLVRSNPDKQIGFLKDWRRMNVAVTRARRMLLIVGDSDCVSSDAKIKSLIEWVGEHGSIQSAEQLREDPSIRFGLGKITQLGSNTKQNKSSDPQKKNKDKNKKKEKKEQKKEAKEKISDLNNQQAERKQQHTAQEQEDLKVTFRALLGSMKGETVIEDLNAYERKIMHQVAEEFGFGHVTSEDKAKITIKPILVQSQQEEWPAQINAKKEKKKNKKKSDKQKQKEKEKGPQNLKELIGQGNSSEDQQQLKKQQKQDKKQKEEEEKPKQEQEKEQEKTKAKKNKKKNKDQQKEEQEEEDWEKLLDEFTAELPKNDQCLKCKKKITSVTAAECRFCHMLFCRHDVLAEEHGCEERAREHARRDNNLDKYLEEGARKIKDKLKEQEELRRKKPNNKDKDNKKK